MQLDDFIYTSAIFYWNGLMEYNKSLNNITWVVSSLDLQCLDIRIMNESKYIYIGSNLLLHMFFE